MCDCGNPKCIAIFKHPRATNWVATPHWDDEQLDNISEAGWFDTGYGILCRGLIVIDVDARNGGVESFARLATDHPEVSEAGMIVLTGSGGGSKHLYFSVKTDIPLIAHHPDYPGVDFRSGSSFVVGVGSHHASGNKYTLAIGGPEDIEPAPPALIDLLRKPDRHRADYDGRAVDVSHSDIAEMLSHVTPDSPYDTWIKVGMSIHHATGGTGFDVWDKWSQGGSSYDPTNMATHWHSFGRCANPVTLGTLVHHAEEGGWVWPVTFGDDAQEPETEQQSPSAGIDTSGIDLTRPPGFTGRVASYIESKARRPRRHIAVGAALFALGSVYSLHYTTSVSGGVVTNMIAIGVAGSRTGKEAIEQGAGDIIRAAGFGDAIAGKIKSEQEMIRNLIRHQTVFHLIDEIGLELQKLQNASKRGGAPYLEGVIATLMSAYGKANGIMPLTGDAKRDVQKELRGQISNLQRAKDENTGGPHIDRKIAKAEEAYERTRDGLLNPIMALMGFTTPVTFDGLMDMQSGTNGLIGRSLIFVEHDTTPRPKENFIYPSMPEDMAATLRMLASGGIFDGGDRIEHYGPRTPIPTSSAAQTMLKAVSDDMQERAEGETARSGLESLWMGAYELVEKVSLILAVPEGLRTEEHVRWSYALVKRDVEMKARAIVTNDRARDNPLQALQAKLLNLCSRDDGETMGVLANRCRPRKKEEIAKALDGLIEMGRMSKIKDIVRGKEVPRYKSG